MSSTTADYEFLDKAWQQFLDDMEARKAIRRSEQLRLEAERREAERRRRERERARLSAAQAGADDAERSALRLERLAKSAGVQASISRPAAPARSDADSLEEYTAALSAEVAGLQSRLRAALSGQEQQASATALETLGRSRTAAELLDAFAAQSRARPTGDALTPQRRRERALRVLDRLSGAAANSIPADMEALMAELIGAPDDTRAEALELELRLRVQRFNQEQARRDKALAEARELLAALPDARACDPMRQELELAAAGLAPLTDAMRARAREARAAGEKELADLRCEHASEVLAQTLQDLDYAVDGIENTLFVEGGVAHFNKAEWGDYCVRLRVDPREHTLNFNMVRERADAAAEDHARADHAAESSWCTGLPKLAKTLEARGLRLNVKRQLAAAAMPLQLVEPGALPAKLKPQSGRRAAEPKARTMDP